MDLSNFSNVGILLIALVSFGALGVILFILKHTGTKSSDDSVENNVN